MNIVKWYFILAIVFVFMIFSSLAIMEYSRDQVKIACIEAGHSVEECRP